MGFESTDYVTYVVPFMANLQKDIMFTLVTKNVTASSLFYCEWSHEASVLWRSLETLLDLILSKLSNSKAYIR